MTEPVVDTPAPPPRAFETHIVKVTLPRPNSLDQASVHNESRTLAMLLPSGLIAKRFAHGERVAFFRAELDGSGILEICDRVPDKKW